MKEEGESRQEAGAEPSWKRRAEYALGIVIETSAVGAISLLALLVMYVVEAIVR
jgi:hypothetical protein